VNIGQLKTTLDRYLKRTDLRDLYDNWIAFTSNRIDVQLRLQEQEYRTVTVPTEQYIALPPDYIDMRHLETSADGGWPVRFATPDQVDYRNLALNQGRIQFCTIVNNQLELTPSPAADSVAELEMFYFAKLPTITADSATNKVLSAYPQLYIYGCMIEASAFRQHDGDMDNYSQMWKDYAKELTDRQERGRYGSGTLHMRAN
jgi:hypothetical protein